MRRHKAERPLIMEVSLPCSITAERPLAGKTCVDSDGDAANEFWAESPLIMEVSLPCSIIADPPLAGKTYVDSDGDVANEFWEEMPDGELKCIQLAPIAEVYHDTTHTPSKQCSGLVENCRVVSTLTRRVA